MEELRVQVQKLTLVSTHTTTCQAGQGQQTTRTVVVQTNPSTPVTGRNRQTCALAMETEKATTQQRLRTYPHQPDTDVGRVTYRRQMAQWTASRGVGDTIMEATPVPLRPGTAATCSSKCFKCSTHGHRAAQCVLADNHPARLSREEACWRAICRSILGPINRGTTTEMHLVFDEQGCMRQEWGTEEQEPDQEKEEGSPT
jgi:hypothetical protein